jgi:hypothetical protein
VATDAVALKQSENPNSGVEEFLGQETVLAAGGGGLGTGTLLGAYALLRRRWNDSASDLPSGNDEDGSANSADSEDADVGNDQGAAKDSDEPALEATVPALDSLVEQSRDGEFLTYRGYHTDADEPVLVHTLVPSADETLRQSFIQTISGWYNGHSHPNVVTIHERGTDPQPWVAVERFLDGSPLGAEFELAPSEVVAVMTDAAEAIRNVGLYNASHGNLMPDNVWIIEEDDSLQGIVGDWGLRRAVAEAQGETQVTSYTAPEQLARGPAKTNDATDVYGLGAVTYEALTGKAPVPATEDAILAGEIPPPSEASEAPKTLNEPVMRALATDPDERFDSTYDFASALKERL